MKLKNFLENLNEFVKQNPKVLELDVVTSSDDEGNSYNLVHYSPSIGIYKDREFEITEDLDEADSVCIN